MSNNPRHLRPPLTLLDKVLHYFADQKKSTGDTVHCIQVGANDGKTNDPIYPYITGYNWKAILIEPQTYVFENELKPNYEGYENVCFENVAIASESGRMPFYSLSFTHSRWATGLAGFVRSHLESQIEKGYVQRNAEKHGETLPDNIDDYIAETEVRLDSFNNIIERNAFERIDILCIDTEGYDYEVLRLFDFDRRKPEVVVYESKGLSDDDFVESKNLLSSHGYTLYWHDGNTLATTLKLPLSKKWGWRIQAFLEKL